MFSILQPILYSCHSMRILGLFKSKAKNAKKIPFSVLRAKRKHYILLSKKKINH